VFKRSYFIIPSGPISTIALPRSLFAGGYRSYVPQRLKVIAVLVAWFLATGSQWDLVQTFGWVRMTITYSKTMPITTALKKTFDGEMCTVCEVVQEAKQHAAGTSMPLPSSPEGKMLMVFSPIEEIVFASITSPQASPSDASWHSLARSAPPIPPPRAA